MQKCSTTIHIPNNSYLFVDKFLSKRYPFGVPRFFNCGIFTVCDRGFRIFSIHPPPRPNRVVKYTEWPLGAWVSLKSTLHWAVYGRWNIGNFRGIYTKIFDSSQMALVWRAWPHSRSAIVSPPGPKFQSCLYSVSSWDPICNPIFPILKKMQFVRQKLEIPINPWTPIMEQLITGQWRHQAIYLSMIARFPGFFLTKNRENPENRIAYRKYDIISRYSQNIDSIGVLLSYELHLF